MSRFDQPESVDGIAIVGVAGRFPGARNVDEYWRNLRDGMESITFFSNEEIETSGVDPATLRDPNYVAAKGLLSDVELFDASFFGLSPREAEVIDPQHRLFLECAWEALESAGYDPERYAGPIGVYAGASMNTYLLTALARNPGLLAAVGGYQLMLGNDKDFVTTRVSYKLNLRGPSIDIQTACSTSLVAVHAACQSLLTFQCDMALAGGVSIMLPHKAGYLYQEGMILSPDGHCRPFDSEAQGTISGEGVGLVVLKRLADALVDGDRIRAVIRGSAVNNDGSTKVGYTAPSVDGQAEAIARAQALAGIESDTITYVEAHGTGTSLGDPIEIAALTQAFASGTTRKGYCAIGSVKSNIGHLDAAAGVAGLIKTVLMLEHRQLPPSLHFKKPNPRIDFANSPFYVNAELREWPDGPCPRRAGVSSFGIGGTNAHVVLEEAPTIERSTSLRTSQLLTLSARSGSALDTATANLAEHLRRNPDLAIADVAFTLQTGRREFEHRRAVVCTGAGDAAEALETLDPSRVASSEAAKANHPVSFTFPGQGTQYPNMTQELYKTEPFFREQVDRCAELLKAQLGTDLRDLLYPAASTCSAAGEALRRTAFTQPALFVVEYALARLWMEWGIEPRAMIGHSIGEYVAACLAGVFSLDDALALVAERGRLIQDLPGGSMLAVGLPEAQARAYLAEDLSLAAINAPELCVISGPAPGVAGLAARLDRKGIHVRQLLTSHAFHSRMMDPIVGPYRELVSRVALHPPTVPFISNVSGTWMTAEDATDPGYWARHLRESVRFVDGIRELLKTPRQVILEVGPGTTLTSLARQQAIGRGETVLLSSTRHPHDPSPDSAFLMKTLGQLWLSGVAVDWPAVHTAERRRRVPLPTYPFERHRYWVEPADSPAPAGLGLTPRGDEQDSSVRFFAPSWKRSSLPAAREEPEGSDKPRRWLVFADGYGLATQLTARLVKDGHEVITVVQGTRFQRMANATYAVNPAERADYVALLEELRATALTPDVVTHLWSVASVQKGWADQIEGELACSFYSLLYLAQALGRTGVLPQKIDVVSNGVQEVLGDEHLCPARATVLGPCRVVPLEYPGIVCRSIDVVLPEPASDQKDALVDLLAAELESDSDDPAVAYRGRHRWLLTLDPVPHLAEMRTEPASGLRDEGVYLITGGLGGIGLVLAKHLARAVRARLVLVGRSELPDRTEWERCLEVLDERDPLCRRIREVLELEELGARVLVAAADVANLERMREVVEQAQLQFGPIRGVIHAAGVPGGGIVQLRETEDVASVLRSKVQGTLVLDALLGDAALDFFVVCSSINSLLPAPGQVDYCAANAFLDAFVSWRRGLGSSAHSAVNWDTWGEVGMAFNVKVPPHLLAQKEEILKQGLRPAEGEAAFSQIVRDRPPQVLVSRRHVDALRRTIEDQMGPARTATVERPASPSTSDLAASESIMQSARYTRPNLRTTYVAPRDNLEQTISGIWQSLLGIEPIGIHDDFFELGGHSLMATQVVSRLRETYQVELPLRSLFEATNVAQLAERLQAVLWATRDRQADPVEPDGEREEFDL